MRWEKKKIEWWVKSESKVLGEKKRGNAAMLSEFLVRQMTPQTGGLERGSEGQRRHRERDRERGTERGKRGRDREG